MATDKGCIVSIMLDVPDEIIAVVLRRPASERIGSLSEELSALIRKGLDSTHGVLPTATDEQFDTILARIEALPAGTVFTVNDLMDGIKITPTGKKQLGRRLVQHAEDSLFFKRSGKTQQNLAQYTRTTAA